MANKATRALRLKIRAAGLRGETEVEHKTPVYNYHTFDNDDFRTNPSRMLDTVRFPTAVLGKSGIVSQNRKRNMAMRVFINTLDNRKSDSITRHEPLVKGEPVIFKNHKQYKDFSYRQPHIKTSRETIPTSVTVTG
jgi:hypothetical protein